MIIEFIGTPGSGKTTLLPTVAAYLQEQGICARTVVEAARPYAQRNWIGRLIVRFAPRGWQHPLLWQLFFYMSALYRISFFLAHPRLIAQVLRSQTLRPISIEARHHALHWFFRLIGYYEFLQAHAQPHEALLLDEGFVHRVVQMNASASEVPNRQRVAKYLAMVPRPDVVIAVHAPWTTCVDRIYQRGIWARFRTKSPAEVATYVRHAHCIVNMAVEQLRDGGWPLIEVENCGDDASQPMAELRRKLAELSLLPCPGRVEITARIGGWT